MKSEAQDYGTYVLFPQGSVRVMGMGGASAASIDDATALVFNPAGAALSDWKVDFGGADNKVDNQELGTNFPDTYGTYETEYDAPYSYLFYSGAVRLGSWVIGAGYSNPFFNNYVYVNPISQVPIHQFQIKIRSFDAMVARRFGKYFAIGVAGHWETIEQSYQNTSLTGTVAVAGISTSGQNSYASIGAVLRNEVVGVGIAHSPKRHMTVDKSGDDSLAAYNTVAFRDAVIPAKTTVGVSVRVVPRLLIAVDVDQYSAVSNSIYVSSVSTSYEYLKAEVFRVYHGGLEVNAFEKKWFELILRGGGYREPTRFTNGRDRDHLTYGLEARLGPVVFSIAQDRAPGFNNFSQGLSISLKSF